MRRNGLIVLGFSCLFFATISVAQNEETPAVKLHQAAYQGKTQEVIALLKQGTSVDPLWAGDSSTPLMAAVENNHLETAQVLIKAGANVNAMNDQGFTSLMSAAKNGNLQIAQELIKKKANVNAKNEFGSVLTQAIHGEAGPEFIQLLTKAGADVNLPFSEGRTPLREALYWKKLEIAKVLISAGADVNAADREGKNALAIVADRQYLDLIPVLKAAKADMNATDGRGSTPLLEAIQWNKTELAEALIANGAGINTADEDGETPLMYSIKWSGNITLIQALLNAGADVSAKNAQGKTAIELAERKPDILNLLRNSVPELKAAAQKYEQQIAANVFKGSIRINGKPVEFKYLYAWVEPDSFHKQEMDLKLLFSNEMIENPMKEFFSPEPPALQFNFSLTQSDRMGSGLQVFTQGRTEAISSTNDRIVITKLEQNQVEGRIYSGTMEPQKTSWDVSFTAALQWPKDLKPVGILGSTLPSDGGDPFKAYQGYWQSLRAGNMAAIHNATLESGVGAFFRGDLFKELLPRLSKTLKPNITVLSAFSNGKVATLFLQNTDDTASSGIAKLVLISNQWKVSADTFLSFD
jgi:ankyrin repeat protein